MTFTIQDLHPNVKTLASRYVDAKHTGKDVIEVQALDDIQKRWLFDHNIGYSFNSEINKWEIPIKK